MGEPVHTIRLKDPAPRASGRRGGLPRWLAPLLPLVFLSATIAGVWLVMRGPAQLFGGLVAVAIVLGLGWVIASTVLPNPPVDRTCPDCGLEDGLHPAHEDTTRGVACRACDYRDETASAWMIAEEDGPLEDVVLRERAARRGQPEDGTR